MHTVINTKKTILVEREDNYFVIIDLDTGEAETLLAFNLQGSCFKYESECLRKFKSVFPNKDIDNIILSYEASDYMTDIIHFNRLDN